jgi:hypothetical protein
VIVATTRPEDAGFATPSTVAAGGTGRRSGLEQPMNPSNLPSDPGERGIGGILRVVVALCVTALAGLAILFVLDLIPRDQLTDLTTKLLSIGGIVLVASVALGFLARR